MGFSENCYNYVFEKFVFRKSPKFVINIDAPLVMRLS